MRKTLRPPSFGRSISLRRTLLTDAFHEPQLVGHARLIVQRQLEGRTYKEIAISHGQHDHTSVAPTAERPKDTVDR